MYMRMPRIGMIFSLVLNLRAKQIDLFGRLAINCLILEAQPGVCFVWAVGDVAVQWRSIRIYCICVYCHPLCQLSIFRLPQMGLINTSRPYTESNRCDGGSSSNVNGIQRLGNLSTSLSDFLSARPRLYRSHRYSTSKWSQIGH